MKMKILVLFAVITAVLSACGEGIHFVDTAVPSEPAAIVEEVQQEQAETLELEEEIPVELPSEKEEPEVTEMPEPVSEQQETVAESTPAPVIQQTAVPAPTAEPTPAATAAPAAISYSYGSIPFRLSEFPNDWWSIDSSDDAYWACANNINAMRRAAGLGELSVDGGLSSIANSRCEALVAAGDFSHEGQCTAGEILGLNYNSASAACSAWQASPSHYAVITGGYSRMGIGCLFEQMGGTLWCVVFE